MITDAANVVQRMQGLETKKQDRLALKFILPPFSYENLHDTNVSGGKNKEISTFLLV
jgi:hypothetical protein